MQSLKVPRLSPSSLHLKKYYYTMTTVIAMCVAFSMQLAFFNAPFSEEKLLDGDRLHRKTEG